jgi:hypothetical protein
MFHPQTTNALAQLYEQDYYLWLVQTAQLLKNKQLAQLDIDHLLEEIEDMGKREKRALISNLEILLMHLLKYQYQPENRSNSWRYTIFEHRDRIEKQFKDSPSLKAYCLENFDAAYNKARQKAAIETGLALDVFPNTCPFSPEDTLDAEFLPG